MDVPAGPTQRLAEFIAALSAAGTETAAAQAAVERAAEALDADAAAIVCGGELVAATGYPAGNASVAELARARPGVTGGRLEVPGVGACAAAAVTLEHPAGGTLVVARGGPRGGLTSAETGLLRGMAQVAATTMRLLSVVDRERAARAELERLAAEQAALRRVAVMAAGTAAPEEVFTAVAAQVGRVLGGDHVAIVRYETGVSAAVVAAWAASGRDIAVPVGTRLPITGTNVHTLVFQTGRPARLDTLTADVGPELAPWDAAGARSAVGVPISVEDRLWGAMIVSTRRAAPLSVGTEARLAGFTGLVATAVADAQARLELSTLAEEQAALRRVATLVARREPPAAVFAAVAEEAGRILAADLVSIGRYDADETLSAVATWSAAGDAIPIGVTAPVGRFGVGRLVRETGRPARMDHYGPETAITYDMGVRAAVGAPITVEGRLWGVVAVGTRSEDTPLAPGTEDRLAGFTELAATAIANAQTREDLQEVADEQAALRRVATLVARAAPPEEVFAAVTSEVGQLLEADLVSMDRYDPGGTVTVLAARPATLPAGWSIGGRNVSTLVFQTGRPARIDDYADASGPGAGPSREWGVRSAVGAPITVEGRLWGVMFVGSRHERALPAGTEARLAGFTELVATAIANAQAREELRDVADEQAALRRVATLVARGASPDRVFAAVTAEIGRVLSADYTGMARYDGSEEATIVGLWTGTDARSPVTLGDRVSVGGRNSTTLVFQTGRPVRIDDYDHSSGAFASAARGWGFRSSVGVPISVRGQLWGVVTAGYARKASVPADAEQRMADFTELIVTAIANAEAQAELVASRARIVATADATRRRIERDLHDGAQQRLVSLVLQLRAAQAAVPRGLDELAAELDRVAAGLTSTLEELREYARGIHPAILADGGLGAALRVLAGRSPVPVRLDLRTTERLPEHVEVTAYYVVSEALANATKHASASAVTVDVEAAGDVLSVSVSDDGVGGADLSRGTGLVGLKDRVEAIGGTLIVDSRPRAGTRLVAELPVASGP